MDEDDRRFLKLLSLMIASGVLAMMLMNVDWSSAWTWLTTTQEGNITAMVVTVLPLPFVKYVFVKYALKELRRDS